jgi:mutator protein MutT
MDDPIEVAAGVMFREGRLLIAQRHESDHLGGLWEFPGGKIEPGETFEECLRRELMEELGVNVTVEELLEITSHEYLGHKVKIRFFQCKIFSGNPKPLDCQSLKWVDAVELGKYEFPPADVQLIQRLRREPKWWIQSDLNNSMKETE